MIQQMPTGAVCALIARDSRPGQSASQQEIEVAASTAHRAPHHAAAGEDDYLPRLKDWSGISTLDCYRW